MNSGRMLFSQLIDFLPYYQFQKCVTRYHGDHRVVLTGSGVSADSGLPTFRDSHGLWNSYSWEEVASPEGWRARPEAVLEFYNERRR